MTLGPLQDKIWLHIGTRPRAHADRVAAIAEGVVVQAPGQTRNALDAQQAHPFMLQHDAKQLEPESLWGPDYQWLLLQQDADILSSRVDYLATAGDVTTLREAVERCVAFVALARKEHPTRPVVATMAVHNGWLKDKGARARLSAALATIDAPVGLMIGGSSHDPLDHPAKVEGLLEVINGLASFVLLRTDHAALGAYAFGAQGGSIGLGTGTRHFVGHREFAQKDLDDPTPRLLLRAFHAWWRGSKVGAYAADPLFDCFCPVCEGLSLSRFQSEELAPEADRHSAAVWTELMMELRLLAPERRQEAWLQTCLTAYRNLEALEDQVGLPHPPSKQLKAWLFMAGVVAV